MSERDRDVTLIGIDCAVQSKNMGIAVGRIHERRVMIEEICVGVNDPAQHVASVVENRSPVILALDSPLGWPAEMGRVLNTHSASEPLPFDANHFFRRETDRFVKRNIGKQSLDVGADRIARTAHAAVGLLSRIRVLASKSIRLAWTGQTLSEVTCIEVYPAATLEAIGLSSRGYKGGKEIHSQARERLLGELNSVLKLSEEAVTKAVANDDAFDAALCCVAAADFVGGNVFEPEDLEISQKEGWIWVRKP